MWCNAAGQVDHAISLSNAAARAAPSNAKRFRLPVFAQPCQQVLFPFSGFRFRFLRLRLVYTHLGHLMQNLALRFWQPLKWTRQCFHRILGRCSSGLGKTQGFCLAKSSNSTVQSLPGTQCGSKSNPKLIILFPAQRGGTEATRQFKVLEHMVNVGICNKQKQTAHVQCFNQSLNSYNNICLDPTNRCRLCACEASGTSGWNCCSLLFILRCFCPHTNVWLTQGFFAPVNELGQKELVCTPLPISNSMKRHWGKWTYQATSFSSPNLSNPVRHFVGCSRFDLNATLQWKKQTVACVARATRYSNDMESVEPGLLRSSGIWIRVYVWCLSL